MGADDGMEVDAVLDTLGTALALQARSLVTMTVLAGTLRGMAGAGIKSRLREFAAHEAEDTCRLTEKLSALGGHPAVDLGEIRPAGDPQQAIRDLLDDEQKAIAALHAVIPHTGQEPRSEALEHLLEHAIMRKQQQVDYLWHAADLAEPPA
ncbi:MAG TPA: ferritin-like domain-containing protein [Mycobacteriales bacterium]